VPGDHPAAGRVDLHGSRDLDPGAVQRQADPLNAGEQ
jgi:hypothetical protein